MSEQTRKMRSIDAILMAMGAIIGAGVFSLTGTAVGAAGPGVPVAFILAGIFAFLFMVPIMFVASALPAKGGQYLYVSRFLSPVWGFMQIWNYILQVANLTVMGIAAGQYIPSIIPAISPTMAGLIVTVGITVACLLNVRASAGLQNAMVITMLVALALFVIMGFPHIKNFSFSGMFTTKGIGGILMAVTYVRYAALGGAVLVNLGGEIDDPGRTIPRSIVISTLGVSVIYALVGLVAVGVVPWEQMIGQPLSVAGITFMPGWAFNFFIVGGALFAVMTSLLSKFMDLSRAYWAAADDGFFPSWFKATNKHGVPHRILIIMGILASIPIILGTPLEIVFAIMSAPGSILGILVILPAIIAPKKLPDRFDKAWFKLSMPVVWALVIFQICFSVYFSRNLFSTLDTPTIIGIVVFFGAGLAYYYYRINSLKKQGIDLVAQMTAYDPSWLE